MPVDVVADAFRAKYGGRRGVWRVERARKLEAAWEERLAHQVHDLLSFEDVYDEVHARVQAWEEVGRALPTRDRR